MHSPQPTRWADGAIVYHIYPRSFADSNNDGIGDLPGITAKLDYLKDVLHVDALWLSPFYPSPMADFGYDISDYCDVDPIFGNLHDFRALLQAAHTKDLKVIIDFVPNHTSDEHAWFKESRSARDNPKRNWYVWRDGQDAKTPPNNWLSVFGGPAWQFDEKTQQYYLHSFHTRQPDLNWANPEVRDAMKDAMRFWLDMGVDGFRLDAVDWMGKHPDLLDEPGNAAYRQGIDHPYDVQRHLYSRGDAVKFSYLSEIALLLEEYDQRFMVAETYPARHNLMAEYVRFYDAINPRVAAPFNFEGILLPWQAQHFKGFIDSFQGSLQPGWIPSYVLGNHDFERLASRFGKPAARAAAVLQLSLPGMPYIYYGEELGMCDVPIPPERSQDPNAKSDPDGQGRDPARTPMQWSAERHAGFSQHEPWLPIAANYKTDNVAAQLQDPASFLRLYQQLTTLRHSVPALAHGTYQPIETSHYSAYVFVRELKGERYATLVNFSASPVTLQAPLSPGVVLLSSIANTTVGQKIDFKNCTLRGNEACIVKLG